MIHPQTIRRRRLRLVFGAALVVSLLIALLLTWQNRATAAGDVLSGEAFPFNHQKHIVAGVQCVFCHPGVLNGAVAGLPSVQKCVGCHQNIRVAGKEGQASVDLLMQVWDQGRPLRWEKTYDQPDFVYFSHRPHISGGVNCENCHGDVGRTRSALRLNMGFCLQCHRQQEPEKMVRLVSCATCHQ